MLIETREGSRYFISRSRLHAVLDLPAKQHAAAVELLVAEGYLTPHRRNRSPAHGFLLPPEWSSEHVLHLRRLARNLLADEGVKNADEPSLGRILRW